MGTLKTVLIVIEAICSIALIVVVLLQSGKEAGLSSALTGASETYLSKNKQGNLDAKLASLTKWKRSISFCTRMSNGVVMVPSSW